MKILPEAIFPANSLHTNSSDASFRHNCLPNNFLLLNFADDCFKNFAGINLREREFQMISRVQTFANDPKLPKN